MVLFTITGLIVIMTIASTETGVVLGSIMGDELKKKEKEEREQKTADYMANWVESSVAGEVVSDSGSAKTSPTASPSLSFTLSTTASSLPSLDQLPAPAVDFTATFERVPMASWEPAYMQPHLATQVEEYIPQNNMSSYERHDGVEGLAQAGIAGDGIARSCAPARSLSYAPNSRPLLNILTQNEEMGGPDKLYPPVALHDASQVVPDPKARLKNVGVTGGYEPLNVKELFGAFKHRLRTVSTDA